MGGEPLPDVGHVDLLVLGDELVHRPAVDRLPQDVGVTGVSRYLVERVQGGPAPVEGGQPRREPRHLLGNGDGRVEAGRAQLGESGRAPPVVLGEDLLGGGVGVDPVHRLGPGELLGQGPTGLGRVRRGGGAAEPALRDLADVQDQPSERQFAGGQRSCAQLVGVQAVDDRPGVDQRDVDPLEQVLALGGAGGGEQWHDDSSVCVVGGAFERISGCARTRRAGGTSRRRGG